ncbi:MAG: hypothetical protein ACK5SQ_02255 [Chitinophagales bacterium]|jgi:hypothetical protein
MKNAVKGVASQEQAHKTNEDTFPSNPSQGRSDEYPSDLAAVFEPCMDYSELTSEEDDFRRLLRSSYQPTKAPADLLQRIKQNLRQLDND